MTNDTHEVTVTMTDEDIAFRRMLAKKGFPSVVISMYGSAFRKLIEEEREACAKACDAEVIAHGNREGLVAGICAAAIRARSNT